MDNPFYNSINQLFELYTNESDEQKKNDLFAKMYAEVTIYYGGFINKIAQEIKGDVHDATGLVEDAFMKAVNKYKPGKNTKFSTFYNTVLRQKKISFRRKRDTFEKWVYIIPERRDVGEKDNGQLYLEDFTADYYKPEVMVDTEEEQGKKQLINEIISEADEKERELLLNLAQGFSVNETALKLGICPKTARRRLQKLKEAYEGDYKTITGLNI